MIALNGYRLQVAYLRIYVGIQEDNWEIMGVV